MNKSLKDRAAVSQDNIITFISLLCGGNVHEATYLLFVGLLVKGLVVHSGKRSVLIFELNNQTVTHLREAPPTNSWP